MIDEERGVIVPEGGRLKTQVRQVAPITAPVRKILGEIRSERKRSKITNLEPSHVVFVREDSFAISRDMVDKEVKRACGRAGIEDFVFHCTRHMAKTAWASAGVGVEAAMLASGHASVAMHQHYVHLQRSDIAKAFGVVSPLCTSEKGRNRRSAK